MSMTKSKITKQKYPTAVGQKPSYLQGQHQTDDSEVHVTSAPEDDHKCSDSSMPSFSPVTSPGHRLVDSSSDDSPNTQSAIIVKRVYETP